MCMYMYIYLYICGGCQVARNPPPGILGFRATRHPGAVAQNPRNPRISQIIPFILLQAPCIFFPSPPDQLTCPRFSRHAVHLEKKVEVISAEGYLFQ